jgi:hypothetical protein
VDVRRVPLASFGKKSIPLRVIGTAAFMGQIFFRALFTPNLGGIFFSTSPPLVGPGRHDRRDDPSRAVGCTGRWTSTPISSSR